MHTKKEMKKIWTNKKIQINWNEKEMRKKLNLQFLFQINKKNNIQPGFGYKMNVYPLTLTRMKSQYWCTMATPTGLAAM